MNSFIPWIGGKRLLRKKIIELFPPKEERKRYVEVFGGAAWVLFGICSGGGTEVSPIEVYNDINGELVNLFRIVKNHVKALQEELDNILQSRELFFDYKDQIRTRGFTDIQRAVRFYILLKLSYGANMSSFGMKGRNLENATKNLEDISKRLKNVLIENRDYSQIIEDYDREDTLFYLDPPYFGTEIYYKNKGADEVMGKGDHENLKKILSKIKGKFILSYNDCKEVRDLYKDYEIIEVQRQHNLKDNNEKYCELIIKNF